MEDNPKISITGKRRNFNRHLTRSIPDTVSSLPEPIYEENIDNSTAESERDRSPNQKRAIEKKLGSTNVKKSRLREPYVVTDLGNSAIAKMYRSTVSVLGTKGRRIFGSQEPTVQSGLIIFRQKNCGTHSKTFCTNKKL